MIARVEDTFPSIDPEKRKKNRTFDRYSKCVIAEIVCPWARRRPCPRIEAPALAPRLDRRSCLVGQPISIAILLYQLQSIKQKKERTKEIDPRTPFVFGLA
jgi:hypothetical protein